MICRLQAKTQFSFSDDHKREKRAVGFLHHRQRPLKLRPGAGYVVAYAGDIMTMARSAGTSCRGKYYDRRKGTDSRVFLMAKIIDRKKIEKGRSILERIGEDPDREGLKRTPERIAGF